jgi:hypothetical protein
MILKTWKRFKVKPPNDLEAIHAFRTITTMLSLIQRGTEFTDTIMIPPKDANKLSQLRILDALAALIVRNNEVAAVVAMPAERSGKIQVLVSAHINSEMGKLTFSQPDGRFRALLKYLVTANPRDLKRNRHAPKDSLTVDQSAVPGIRDPEAQVPAHLKSGDANQVLANYLKHDW